jgi:hypothetical protein
MQLKRFTSDDLDEMNSWYKGRNMPELPLESLPEVGFIVKGLACGFIYNMEDKIGLIEGYITPNNVNHRERDEALDLVTQSLLSAAKDLNLNKIMVLTQAQAIYERALKFGFQNIGSFQVMSKDLSDESKV